MAPGPPGENPGPPEAGPWIAILAAMRSGALAWLRLIPLIFALAPAAPVPVAQGLDDRFTLPADLEISLWA